MAFLRVLLLLFVVLYLVPIGISAALYWWRGGGADWYAADRSSAGLLRPAAGGPATVRIFAARTVRWRGVFASHCWIVFRAAGAGRYTRYDYTAWGEPVRVNGFEADGRWFGALPDLVFAADGAEAEALIPGIERAIAGYAWRKLGDYHAWPGPNSNTFVQAVVDAVPGMGAVLPATAIGKDFPYDGRWVRAAASGTGVRATLGGYVSVTVAWVEGVQVSIAGAVAGMDLRRPALLLPGVGRIGFSPVRAVVSPVPAAG